jgi:hypothetical protein
MSPIPYLRVADFSTYFVGLEEWGFSVWAHNTNGVCVYNINSNGRPAAEEAALEQYARDTNRWIATQPESPTVISTQGSLRASASAAATAEREAAAAAGATYSGQVGHVPDTAITGMPVPPAGWLDMPGASNQVAGGGLASRIGQRIDVVTVSGRLP